MEQGNQTGKSKGKQGIEWLVRSKDKQIEVESEVEIPAQMCEWEIFEWIWSQNMEILNSVSFEMQKCDISQKAKINCRNVVLLFDDKSEVYTNADKISPKCDDSKGDGWWIKSNCLWAELPNKNRRYQEQNILK